MNEQYHILSPEWLRTNPLPDDAECDHKRFRPGWQPSHRAGEILPQWAVNDFDYRTRRTDLPSEAYATPPTDTTGPVIDTKFVCRCGNRSFGMHEPMCTYAKNQVDTTGSGREGETDNDKEAIARLEDWLMIVLGNEGANHPVLLDWARVRMLLKRQRLEVEALRRDGAELSVKLAPIYHQLCVLKMSHPHWVQGEWLDTLRAAIDSAQRQDDPQP